MAVASPSSTSSRVIPAPAASSSRPRVAREPLDAVMTLGSKKRAAALIAGLVIAMVAHGTAAARVALIEVELLAWSHQLRLTINERLASTYEIEVEKPKPPEEPKPEEPKPEPPKDEPVAKPLAPQPKADAPPPPPAAAQAGAVMTAPPDNEPVDFTNSFTTGNADQFAGGVTQAGGTSTTAVYDRHAQTGGVPGGTGTAPAPPKPSGPDRSRAAGSVSTDWNCPFPPEADAEQIDEMRVTVEATIAADGRVLNAHFVKDPGFGFGRAAAQCALRQRYQPALDHDGNAIQSTRSFNVSFTR